MRTSENSSCHKETWEGCIVSLTTPTRSSLNASRSVSSRSWAEKASRVLPSPSPVQRCLKGRHTVAVGLMFWLRRNKFVGSYLSLSATSRSYFSGP